jgi:hypothetical protein
VNPDRLTKEILAEIFQICPELTVEGRRSAGRLLLQIFLKIFHGEYQQSAQNQIWQNK